MRSTEPQLGGKVRALRRREGLSQVQMASALGISPSYLNLIESNRRPLPAPLLISIARHLHVGIDIFAADEDERLISALVEAFADPMFDPHNLSSQDVREMATASPSAARAVIALFRAYAAARETGEALAAQVFDGEKVSGVERARVSSEEVSDLIQRHHNHFAELETGAEALWREGGLDREDLYPGLVRYLGRELDVRVQVSSATAHGELLRRYSPETRVLSLSELLPTRTRNFQLAHQIALLTQRPALDRLLKDDALTTDESRRLARVALSNYFAGAVLMPYERVLGAARETRYDIDVMGRRFRVGFEQVCHRLTTLRRPGQDGVPFDFMRVDIAGNISKRFSASGMRLARFSGACPKLNVFSAFLTPGMIRVHVAEMPDGARYFNIARTIQRDAGGWHDQRPLYAVGLGCAIERAREIVYADGVDISDRSSAVPVGVTCPLCERQDCEQRAMPALRSPLKIDENVRGISLYAPVGRRLPTV